MAVSRRRLLRSVALTAACRAAVEGAETTPSLDVLRNVSANHGMSLGDDRLRVLEPVLEQHRRRLQLLRDFAFDDAVEPTQGILDK